MIWAEKIPIQYCRSDSDIKACCLHYRWIVYLPKTEAKSIKPHNIEQNTLKQNMTEHNNSPVMQTIK